jgi:hypothetical protein
VKSAAPFFLTIALIMAGSMLPVLGAPLQRGQATLDCGGSRLTANTTYDPHAPPDDGFAWMTQTLEIKIPGAPPRQLIIDPAPPVMLPDGGRALARVVTSWQCMQGKRGAVIVLMLYCKRDDLGGVCHGEKEWPRLLDTKGRQLDAGYAPQDKRYKSLFARLGIVLNGIELQNATGD